MDGRCRYLKELLHVGFGWGLPVEGRVVVDERQVPALLGGISNCRLFVMLLLGAQHGGQLAILENKDMVLCAGAVNEPLLLPLVLLPDLQDGVFAKMSHMAPVAPVGGWIDLFMHPVTLAEAGQNFNAVPVLAINALK